MYCQLLFRHFYENWIKNECKAIGSGGMVAHREPDSCSQRVSRFASAHRIAMNWKYNLIYSFDWLNITLELKICVQVPNTGTAVLWLCCANTARSLFLKWHSIRWRGHQSLNVWNFQHNLNGHQNEDRACALVLTTARLAAMAIHWNSRMLLFYDYSNVLHKKSIGGHHLSIGWGLSSGAQFALMSTLWSTHCTIATQIQLAFKLSFGSKIKKRSKQWEQSFD